MLVYVLLYLVIGLLCATALQTEYPLRDIFCWPIFALMLVTVIVYILYLMTRDITIFIIKKLTPL